MTNPYHDPDDGKFTFGPGGGGTPTDTNEKKIRDDQQKTMAVAAENHPQPGTNAPDYSIGPARYAGRWNGKPQVAIRTPSSDGYRTRASRLMAYGLKGRYSNREKAYIVSPSKAEKFKKLYSEGWDANIITGKLSRGSS